MNAAFLNNLKQYINKHIYNYSKHTTERYKLTPFNMLSPVDDNVLPYYTDYCYLN